jgi:hypothetical protein
LERGVHYLERLAVTALALVTALTLIGLLIAHFDDGSSKRWVEWMLFGGGGVLLIVLGLMGGVVAGPTRVGGVLPMDTEPPKEPGANPLSLNAMLVPLAAICAGVLVHVFA